jgi:hypothetical protein
MKMYAAVLALSFSPHFLREDLDPLRVAKRPLEGNYPLKQE